MKQGNKKNESLSLGEDSASNKIQQHLQDKNHKITDEDIRNFPVESASEEDSEAESVMNGYAVKITEEDPDQENKSGLESPWNIYS